MQHPAPIESLPDAAQKVLRGPPPMKMMAARGMAPLPPAALVCALYAMAYDADDKLGAAARDTLGKLPDKLLDGALASPELPAPVLDDLSARARGRPNVLARVAQHPAVAIETVVQLARNADEALCELIATNESRLLAHPEIIEALYLNRALRMSTADRLVELAARNGVELKIEGFKEAAASLQNELLPEPGEQTPADDDFRAAIDEAVQAEAEEAAEAAQGGEPDVDVVDRDDEGQETVKKRFAKVEKKLSDMKISELIRAATIGTASQRMILVRSRNKIVARAAINSPMMQAGDAEKIARSTQVSDEVLRIIGGRREWLGARPSIRAELCKNPKTPLYVSMAQLQFLRESDLKGLAKSKNVPQTLKTAANQWLAKRGNRNG